MALLLIVLGRPASGQFSITVTKTDLLIRFEKKSTNRSLVELAPYEDATNAVSAVPLVLHAERKKISIPRFDGERDRLYSGFVALQNGKPEGPMHYVEITHASPNISKYRDSYPRTRSKKGLQVQMIDDAIALGVKYAAFNFDMGAAVKIKPASNDLRWTTDAREFWFDRGYIENLDNRVKRMSGSGAVITLILLNYVHPTLASNKILQHPDYDSACPNHLSAFNTQTPEGLAWFKACVEFLADRYAAPGFPHGRIVNYIVGNEVNSHWYWANMGHASMEQFARDYERTVRICAQAVRKYSSCGRIFISLEHHWNIRYAGADATQGFAGRPFIDYFNRIAKESGNFDWNLAFHPYPEDLFNPRTWKDRTATFSNNTPRITFRNIEMLPRYFQQKELLCAGEPRHIILSEQGFHSTPTPEGEQLQAAAYCYAWRKIVNLNGIDAFILHRHVDNAGEGGLNLGLWRHAPGTTSEPAGRKPIYEVFRLADTPQWKKAFQFALPIIGIKSWKDLKAFE
ncbi:MAG TPA: DUF5722 domain-containing protein [Candidatus Saccharimonadales bacterium]|nr:DUF5722 domain-containing protein [Candidatus Saccharimonadales bacterium]